jgi:hypothetical protein
MRIFPAFLVLVISAVAACNDDKPKAETKGPASAEPIPSDLVYNAGLDKAGNPKITLVTDAGAPVDTTPPQTGSTATLVSPGADPKSPLVYAFTTKARTVNAKITISATGGGPNMPDQPPLHFTFTATPKPKNMMGGDTTFDIKVTKFEVTLPANAPPQAAAQKDQLEKALVGLAGHFDSTTHGDLSNIDFETDKAPQGAGEIAGVLQQAFEFLVVPLPNEPIGIGAKWTKKESKNLADQGAKVATTVTMTLKARDDKTATIQVDATNSGTMPISDPRAPKGSSMTRSTTASFTVVIRLDGVSQKVDGESKNDITQKIPGQADQSMTVKLAQNLESK